MSVSNQNKAPLFRFTIARSSTRRPAVKSYERLPDGTLKKTSYQSGAYWIFDELKARSSEELHTKIAQRMSEPHAMLLNGAPKPGLNLKKSHRRRAAKKWIEKNLHTLIDAGTLVFPVDCDKYRCPPGYGRGENVEKAARYIWDRLPPALAGCTIIVVASSSTGFGLDDGLVSLRMFVILDREYSLAELYRWARGAQAAGYTMIDPRVLLPAQPIYVSRPILINCPDPVPEHLRCLLLKGRDCAGIDVNEFAPALAREEVELRRIHSAAAVGGGWREVLINTVGVKPGSGPFSYFEPLTAGLGRAARAGATREEAVSLCLSLIKARADADRIAKYDRDWLEASFDVFADNDAETRADVSSFYRSILKNP